MLKIISGLMVLIVVVYIGIILFISYEKYFHNQNMNKEVTIKQLIDSGYKKTYTHKQSDSEKSCYGYERSKDFVTERIEICY